MWWPKLTGCATCRCVKPGRIVVDVALGQRRPARAAARAAARRSASISPRSHSRTSVATWSLRERPVCSRLPASPTSCVSRASMFRCTSSRSSFHSKRPASISCAICAMPRSIAAWSSARRSCLARPASRHAPASPRCRRVPGAGRSRRWRCSASPARSSARRTAPTRLRTSCRSWFVDMGTSRAAQARQDGLDASNRREPLDSIDAPCPTRAAAAAHRPAEHAARALRAGVHAARRPAPQRFGRRCSASSMRWRSASRTSGAGSAFDVCHVGVVLRARAVRAGGDGARRAASPRRRGPNGSAQLARGSIISLPAVLAWLALSCALQALAVARCRPRRNGPPRWRSARCARALGWALLRYTRRAAKPRAACGVAPLLAGAAMAAGALLLAAPARAGRSCRPTRRRAWPSCSRASGRISCSTR